MIPLLVGGALMGAKAIFKGIKARKQRKEAEKINDTRPTYNIPTEVGQNVRQYEALSTADRMPGQELMENRLDAGMASDINAVRETGGGGANQLAAIAGLNQNRNSALNDLGMQSAQFRMGAMDKLAGARDTMSQYRDQAFDYNQNQEFQYKRMKKNMLQDASNQNSYGALEDMGSLGGQMMAMGGGGNGNGMSWLRKSKSPTYN
jgi:hypothetical protein